MIIKSLVNDVIEFSKSTIPELRLALKLMINTQFEARTDDR